MRYKASASYDGTGYSGWQIQANTPQTIQAEIQDVLSRILGMSIEITGCGRTDAGVHARNYVFHFDSDTSIPESEILHKANKMLNEQIVLDSVDETHSDFHARFDALSRKYIYRIKKGRDPFDNRFAWEYIYPDVFDLDRLNDAANVLLNFEDFTTFCKTRSDVKTALCAFSESRWSYNEEDRTYEYHAVANRFLRGMIRLIVGACLNVNRGKVSLDELIKALENRQRLTRDWSVPAKGLTLCEIVYPE